MSTRMQAVAPLFGAARLLNIATAPLSTGRARFGSAAMSASTLTIDVVSDVVCPWCYIGKRRLEHALGTLRAREPDLGLEVRWHPFELNPDIPPEGVERARYLADKFGSAQRAAQVYARVRAAGASVGLDLDFDRITRQPRTLDAHRLITWAQAGHAARAGALVEALFRAYFVEGRFVGEADTLAAIAGEAGIPASEARAFLASDALAGQVRDAERRAQAMGISGVPFFIFAGRMGLSGAHEPDAMLEAIAQARDATPDAGASSQETTA
jgi:predicted DsbA family dithiol-disulfide isomerase